MQPLHRSLLLCVVLLSLESVVVKSQDDSKLKEAGRTIGEELTTLLTSVFDRLYIETLLIDIEEMTLRPAPTIEFTTDNTNLWIDCVYEKNLGLFAQLNNRLKQNFEVEVDAPSFDLNVEMNDDRLTIDTLLESETTEFDISIDATNFPLSMVTTARPNVGVEFEAYRADLVVDLETADEQTLSLSMGTIGKGMTSGSTLLILLLIVSQSVIFLLVFSHGHRTSRLIEAMRSVNDPNQTTTCVCPHCRANGTTSAEFCRKCGTSLRYHPPSTTSLPSQSTLPAIYGAGPIPSVTPIESSPSY